MKDIFKVLSEKQKQLNILQREVDALRVATQLLSDDSASPAGDSEMSQPQMVQAILEAHGKPMHVSEIAQQMKKQYKKTVKVENLAVLLYRYAQRGRRFFKEPNKKNTYGLLKQEANVISMAQ